MKPGKSYGQPPLKNRAGSKGKPLKRRSIEGSIRHAAQLGRPIKKKASIMNLRCLFGLFVRVTISVAFAGIFYVGWGTLKVSGMPCRKAL